MKINKFILKKENLNIIKHNVSCSGEVFLSICMIMRQRRQWHPTPVLLPGESHRWRSLEDCSPWGHEESEWDHEESDMTEWLHFHFSLSCIGEGNGNPLQCSCLENPRDGGAWWAAVYGVAQGRTQLKQLSSSSSSSSMIMRKMLHSLLPCWCDSDKRTLKSSF